MATFKQIYHHFPKHASTLHSGMTKVYAVIKHRKNIGVVTPTLHDTLFYTIPIRDRKEGHKNAILAFLCSHQARIYCEALKNKESSTKFYMANNNENNASDSIVSDYTAKDLSYYAFHLGVPLAIICNSYCEGTQREPIYEVCLTEEPLS